MHTKSQFPVTYTGMHLWLRKKYGNATHCENPNCAETSSNFQYALLKGKDHECKRENYIQLCVPCHKSYDRKTVVMVRKAHYLREDQIKFLEKLPGNESEHIRRAIDNYIQEIKNKDVSASASVIGGEKDNG